ncbi:MAG: uroporphyrinogen decarboxylase family protein [Methylomonas sp.]|nr:uroporphyrinogen decarboxylase family protein [Methylomonas sp.]
MNAMQRVLTTLSHREPDRVPLFLLTSLQGARELGLSIEEYFSRADYVVEGQLRLQRKYRSDCITCFFHAAIELEAWGGSVIYQPDCPPNAGPAIIHGPTDIDKLQPPGIEDSPGLMRVLETIRQLKNRVGASIPIIGMVISPFSLPVMQMGFDHYIELIYEQPERWARLMALNEEFCVAWANAQLAAGATAIGYADPVSSLTIIPRELYLKTGQPVARRTLARIDGPTATHLASGRCLGIVDDIAATGTQALGVSALEDLAELKTAAQGKLALIGNLNGVEMRRWTTERAEAEVKRAIAKAGRGGGFILADNHGEIPWQVPDEVLLAICHAAEQWGRYPLDWID